MPEELKYFKRDKNGSIEKEKFRKYVDGKGYEAIPRALMRDKLLSLEARGLMVYLQSLMDEEVENLTKTVLFESFKTNGKRQVSRMWDELIEQGYLLQFRRRNGKYYEYHYMFSVSKYPAEDLAQILNEGRKMGFLYYRKEMLKEADMKNIDISKYLPCDEKQIEVLKLLGVSFSNSQNENQNKQPEINDSSTSQNESPNMGVSKREDSKSKGLDFKELGSNITCEEEEELYIKAHEKIIDSIMTNPDIEPVVQYLFGCGINDLDTAAIVSEIAKDESLINADSIISQMNWCETKAKTDGVFNLPVYFINGLRMKVSNSSVGSNQDISKSFEVALNGELPKVPLYNWLNG